MERVDDEATDREIDEIRERGHLARMFHAGSGDVSSPLGGFRMNLTTSNNISPPKTSTPNYLSTFTSPHLFFFATDHTDFRLMPYAVRVFC